MIAVALIFLTAPSIGVAAEDGGDTRDLVQFRQEIETLKGSEAAERRRVEQDERHIQELEKELKRIETQNQKLGNTASTLNLNPHVMTTAAATHPVATKAAATAARST
jgi:septal ring factor EnvC (AmiA/AmiB activator)